MALSEDELERLFVELETKLYNFALRWLWNPAVAEETVQDAFVRVWRQRDEVEASTARSLLYKITQNLCLNLRRRSQLPVAPLVSWIWGRPAAPAVDEEFLARNRLAALYAAMEQLHPPLREVLLMTEFSEMDYNEVAAALGIPPGTVASRKNSALKQLRSLMQGVEDV
ncbi:MAG: RNA polymerase sigma factor [Bdellovibrionales bacterium]